MQKFEQYFELIFYPEDTFERKFSYLQAVKLAGEKHPHKRKSFYNHAVKLIFDDLLN